MIKKKRISCITSFEMADQAGNFVFVIEKLHARCMYRITRLTLKSEKNKFINICI